MLQSVDKIKGLGTGTHLFVKVLRTRESEGTFSSQAATCYYQSNHSKVGAIWLSAFSKDTTSELASLSPHYPFYAKRQAGKLRIQLLKSFAPTRPGN